MKDSFIFEGKKYISSRRASDISDYASDYIGQLCRAGKLDCRMIGRSWFVTEESIHLHKAAISREEASRSRIENLKGPKVETSQKVAVTTLPVNKVEVVAPVATPAPVAPAPAITEKAPVAIPPIPWTYTDTTKVAIKSPFTYSSDDRPFLPVLNKKTENKSEEQSFKKVVVKNLDKEESKLSKIVVSDYSNKSTISDLALLSSGEKKEEVAIKTETKVNAKPKKSRKILSYPELTRSIILKRVIAPVFVVVMFFGIGTGVYITADKVTQSVGPEISQSAKVATANVYDALNYAYFIIKNSYKSVVAFFTSPARLAVDAPKEFGDVTVSDVTPNGIVLTSSTGSDTSDEMLKQKIAGSFSDEVEVNPDKSGTAGVITPVFKDTKGKDFIYVMVPVKDKGVTAMPL